MGPSVENAGRQPFSWHTMRAHRKKFLSLPPSPPHSVLQQVLQTELIHDPHDGFQHADVGAQAVLVFHIGGQQVNNLQREKLHSHSMQSFPER